MSKGMVVVDMPESCRCIRDDEKGCLFGSMVCQIKQEDVMKHVIDGTKPDWCPIRPVPEKKSLTGDVSNPKKLGNELIGEGWNTCIDEILKDGEEDARP